MNILIDAIFELLDCSFFSNMMALIVGVFCFPIVYNISVPRIRRDD